jgi:pyruvate dehydrogenase (quinone)
MFYRVLWSLARTQVATALLGRSVMTDDSPFSTGGIGHLGTAPSSWTMETCDTLLILGSTMPWIVAVLKQLSGYE